MAIKAYIMKIKPDEFDSSWLHASPCMLAVENETCGLDWVTTQSDNDIWSCELLQIMKKRRRKRCEIRWLSIYNHSGVFLILVSGSALFLLGVAWANSEWLVAIYELGICLSILCLGGRAVVDRFLLIRIFGGIFDLWGAIIHEFHFSFWFGAL